MNTKLMNALDGCLRADYQCGRLIRLISRLAEEEHQYDIRSRIERTAEDYRRMVDFMRKGYNDPERDKMYARLSKEAAIVGLDLYKRLDMQRRPSMLRAKSRVANIDFDRDTIRASAEGFVTDVAMLSLEEGEQKEQRMAQIYERHQKEVSLLFDHILTSDGWTAADADFYASLVLSPTTDIIDAQTIVSAIGLSASQYFDYQKGRTLATIYIQATDERIRQRALVGFVFAIDESKKIFLDDQRQLCEAVCETDKDAAELYELQKQLYYANNAQADAGRVQNEIMGDLMRNPNLKITRFGIEENDDPMNDILHPDASEKAMEEVENAMKKLSDMQQQGADIYFGGFSHMKRYAFFYDLSNWFVPFYSEHPGLKQAREKLGGARFMDGLLAKGPFCDSDKYSFVLAMASVINTIPSNVREMLNSPDAVFADVPAAEADTPAYIRRMYVQDFYRFFNVYSDKGDYKNVLLDGKGKTRNFMCNSLFAGTKLAGNALEMMSFLKKRLHADVRTLLDYAKIYNRKDEAEYLMAMGYLALDAHRNSCLDYFRKAMESAPTNEQAMKGLARAELIYGDAAKAAAIYDRLSLINTDKKVFVINQSLALVKTGDYDKALNNLYRLNLEAPDDNNVNRALAWTLLCKGDAKAAYDIYNGFLERGESNADDVLNMGYAAWAIGKVNDASTFFKHYCMMIKSPSGNGEVLHKAFVADKSVLDVYGISAVDEALMIEITIKE